METESLGTTELPFAFSPRDMLDLYLRPSRFFPSRIVNAAGSVLKISAVLVGINYAFGRIERTMLQADLGRESSLATLVSGSWTSFWGVALGSGLLSALFAWYIGTWWFRVRIRWSGDANAPVERVRAVYLCAGLVSAIPAILMAIVQTARFGNYGEAWGTESVVDILMLAFPIWSCVTAYRGVRYTFDVRPARARFWFLIVPIVVLLFALGVFAALAARMG